MSDEIRVGPSFDGGCSWLSGCDGYGVHSADCPNNPKNKPRVDIQDDIAALLRALGLSDHARPISPHAVVHSEILPAIVALTARAVRCEGALRAAESGKRKHLAHCPAHPFIAQCICNEPDA